MSVIKPQEINLDFTQNSYKDIVVKQNDVNSRSVIVTCTNNGEKCPLDKNVQTCNIKMKTPDNRPIYNPTTILSDGRVQIDFTEQMVLVGGKVDAELEVINSASQQIIHTMNLHVIIVSSVYDNDEIIASPEFDALNEALLSIKESSVSQQELDKKVDKVDGKGLSTNDYTNADKEKLDSISANAESNQNAFSNVIVGSTTIEADSKTDSLTLVAGNNVTLTPDATNDKITIAATDTKYTHPTTSGNKHIPSGGSSGQILRWSADGTAEWGDDNNTTYKEMVGATSGTDGKSGLVPAPIFTDNQSFLRGDGTWQKINAVDSIQTGMNNGTITVFDKFSNVKEVEVQGLKSAAYTESSDYAKSSHTHSVVSTTANGLVPKLDGSTTKFLRADGAWATPPDDNTIYTHPTYTSKSHGLYKVTVDGTGHVSATTAVTKSDITSLGIPTQDTTYSNMTGATSSTDGKSGLVPIPVAGNQASFLCGDGTWKLPNVGVTNISTGSLDGTIEINIDDGTGVIHGSNVAVKGLRSAAYTDSDDYATASHSHSNATTNIAGLMSTSDKTKLDGIATGANNYTHPSYTTKNNGLYKVTVDNTGHVSNAISVTKEDITALGIPAQDTTYSNMVGATSGTDGKSGLVPAPIFTNSQSFLRGDGTWQKINAVDSIQTGMNNGTITVFDKFSNVKEVEVQGLKSAAYTESSDYAPTSHTHNSYINQNAFSNVTIGNTTIAADSTTDTLTLVGSNVTLTPDATNDKVTIGITKSNVTTALGYTPPTTDTTYTGSNGVSISGTTISNSGVRSIATGTSNGTISVNTNGTSANVAVKGLGDAAYKGVDTVVTSGSSKLITSGAVNTAISAASNQLVCWQDWINVSTMNALSEFPDTYSEIMICIDVDSRGIIINGVIPKFLFTSTQYSFRFGYFQNGPADTNANGIGAIVKISSTTGIVISNVYLNGNEVTNNSKWCFLYRK